MSSNILFILTDQWPHNFFARYGLPVPTPHADRLAAEGTVFTNAFTTCNQTLMSSPTGSATRGWGTSAPD